ncbi:hypothetical protein BDY21DRAFT_353318 [Lineolata rhizophorae]|uniref:Uncharacterized protein n=1 Tax=Lineolata rhizophorae TaxID=578093 RepID=A0A6A6NR72_9PEZI|nr:hypothetical protein BDY21DRAFT_353318 [Lineolata rhizophorae]
MPPCLSSHPHPIMSTLSRRSPASPNPPAEHLCTRHRDTDLSCNSSPKRQRVDADDVLADLERFASGLHQRCGSVGPHKLECAARSQEKLESHAPFHRTAHCNALHFTSPLRPGELLYFPAYIALWEGLLVGRRRRQSGVCETSRRHDVLARRCAGIWDIDIAILWAAS